MATEVTQRIEFECTYLLGSILNSHRYRFEVTVKGPQREFDYGAVIPFSTLRRYMKSICPNETFLYSNVEENPGKQVGEFLETLGIRTKAVGFRLSAENLCNYLATNLQKLLDKGEPGVVVSLAKLRENTDSFVSWSPTSTYGWM